MKKRILSILLTLVMVIGMLPMASLTAHAAVGEIVPITDEQLLEVMEEALLLVKTTPTHGAMYFNILRARYFDAYCKTNEDAFLSLGISSSTYYRHIKAAIRTYAANLWCVVIPDLIIAEHNWDTADSLGESPMRVS